MIKNLIYFKSKIIIFYNIASLLFEFVFFSEFFWWNEVFVFVCLAILFLPFILLATAFYNLILLVRLDIRIYILTHNKTNKRWYFHLSPAFQGLENTLSPLIIPTSGKLLLYFNCVSLVLTYGKNPQNMLFILFIFTVNIYLDSPICLTFKTQLASFFKQ